MLDMTKIQILRATPPKGCCLAEYYEKLLEKSGDLKSDYFDYMTSLPVDCDTELLSTDDADYDRCCALLTMLIREDCFTESGSFDKRCENGDVKRITDRMIRILEEKEDEIRNLLRRKVAETI